MNQHFYHTSQFAQKASVTIRTLRFYDQVGLLSPAEHTEAGYRLYTDEDFFRLQQILALKFLGFSLEEIKHCLQVSPIVLPLIPPVDVQFMLLSYCHQKSSAECVIHAPAASAHKNKQHEWHALWGNTARISPMQRVFTLPVPRKDGPLCPMASVPALCSITFCFSKCKPSFMRILGQTDLDR